MRRFLSFVLLLALADVSSAEKPDAAKPADTAPTPPPVDTTAVDAELAALRAAAPGQARLDAAARLLVEDRTRAPALAAALARPRRSTDAERREILARFGAEVPTPDGRFVATRPERLKRGEKPPEPPDWLAALAAMPESTPAVLESLETVVLLRALAASKAFGAAETILDFAFSPDGLTFRDECGRQLRAMSPYSLPALVRGSQHKKEFGGSLGRYATYQLDRLDKNRPSYALAAAPDDEVEVEILNAIADVHHPDAVQAVLERCDAASPQVRRAAREAWAAYVSGPPPPPAPKAKRKLPGGKMSDEELPLYLTYRELARQELIRKMTELGQETLKKESEEAISKRLFELFDQRRSATWDATLTEGKALAGEQKWAAAAARFDEILVHEPLYAHRADMAPTYLALGKELADKGEWKPAVIAYEKALSLDATGAAAEKARAEVHYARAQVLRGEGHAAEDELAQALAADPAHGGAKKLLVKEKRAEVQGRSGWMLWAGITGGALAAVLAGLGLWMKRRA
jgi:hypothetical protein